MTLCNVNYYSSLLTDWLSNNHYINWTLYPCNLQMCWLKMSQKCGCDLQTLAKHCLHNFSVSNSSPISHFYRPRSYFWFPNANEETRYVSQQTRTCYVAELMFLASNVTHCVLSCSVYTAIRFSDNLYVYAWHRPCIDMLFTHDALDLLFTVSYIVLFCD